MMAPWPGKKQPIAIYNTSDTLILQSGVLFMSAEMRCLRCIDEDSCDANGAPLSETTGLSCIIYSIPHGYQAAESFFC